MPIMISCPECGHRFKVRDDLAGRRVKCPECGVAVAVPADDDDEVAPGPPPRRSRGDDYEEGSPRRKPARYADDDDDRPRKRRDDDDDDRPRRKKKSNAGLIIGLCAGGAVLVVGVVILIIVLVSGGKKESDGAGGGGGGAGAGGGSGLSKNDLRQIGIAYHNYHDAMRRGPSKAEDLLPFLENQQRLIEPMKDGRLVFIWNVRILDMTDGTSNTILAYEKNTPTSGGFVIFGDAQVERLSAAEFKTKPLAKPRK